MRAVHVHHGWPASDRLAEAASSVASDLGVSFRVVRVETPPGASPEAQARRVRYEALESAAREGEWILTGHTSDDQAETVVDHLLRASGADGLRGIPARRPPFARPLLDVPRSTTRELATLAGLAWIDDPSNESLDALRNRIRHRLLPELERYNPRIRQALATTARLLGADVDHIESDAFLPVQVHDGSVGAPSSLMTIADPAIARRRVRRLLAAAGIEHPGFDVVERVLEVARREKVAFDPAAGYRIHRAGPLLVVDLPASEGLPGAVLLDAGEITYGSWIFESWILDRPPVAMPIGAAWMVADSDVVVDPTIEAADNVEGALDVLARSGVPVGSRRGYPVLTSGGRPLWIPGVRRLPFGWVDSSTDRYLVVLSKAVRRWQM